MVTLCTVYSKRINYHSTDETTFEKERTIQMVAMRSSVYTIKTRNCDRLSSHTIQSGATDLTWMWRKPIALHGNLLIYCHIANNQEWPIAFTPRALIKAEQNYFQLDRGKLSYFLGHLFQYLFVQSFTLITDIQPVIRMFHQNVKLLQMTSTRLQRYATISADINYDKIQEGIWKHERELLIKSTN